MRPSLRLGVFLTAVTVAGALAGAAPAGGSATKVSPAFTLVQMTKAECPLPRKLFGKACVDDGELLLRDAWSLAATRATWEPPGWTTTYTWSVPGVVTPAGAPITLILTAEAKQPGLICPAIGASGGLPLKKAGETSGIEICAEQGKGKASGSKTVMIVSPSGGPVYLVIGLQDGPQYTYKYVASAPAAPGSLSPLTIKQIQGALRYMGVYNGPVDGRTSPRLTTAIKDFQRSVGIKVDGRCGPQCRRALADARALDDPAVDDERPPMTKRTVTELQDDLRKLGFYTGPLDGRNDASLAAAVKNFQRDAGIPADGTCEVKCQLALVKALNRS